MNKIRILARKYGIQQRHWVRRSCLLATISWEGPQLQDSVLCSSGNVTPSSLIKICIGLMSLGRRDRLTSSKWLKNEIFWPFSFGKQFISGVTMCIWVNASAHISWSESLFHPLSWALVCTAASSWIMQSSIAFLGETKRKDIYTQGVHLLHKLLKTGAFWIQGRLELVQNKSPQNSYSVFIMSSTPKLSGFPDGFLGGHTTCYYSYCRSHHPGTKSCPVANPLTQHMEKNMLKM